MNKKISFKKFMLLYAAIFLSIAALGLMLFWGYMDAYEDSRIKSNIEAYVANVTPQYIYDRSGDLIDSIDHRLQSEEACKKVIMDFFSHDISYARKISECTDTKMVYALRYGDKVIGQVEFEPSGKKRFGFTPWKISKDSFDLSFLISDKTIITVDSTMKAYVGDVLLDESYVTEAQRKYEPVKDFYDEVTLPYKVTYSTGPILGEVDLHAVDANGNTVQITEEADLNVYLNNCTETVHNELDTFIQDFIDRYSRYLASTKVNRQYNYQQLTPYLLNGSDLKKRISHAYDSMQWGKSESDTIVEFTSNYLIDLGEGKYLCDVTYSVDSLGKDGVIHRTVSNAQVFLVRTGSGLKAERLLSY